MGHALAQVRLQRDTLLPEDVVINTFHFETPTVDDVTLAEANAITTRLVDFYTDIHTPGVAALNTYLSEMLATDHEVRVYDQSDPVPRAPRTTTAFAMTTATGTALPSEVALCLSFRAAAVSGDNPARRRGRIYLGPFNSTTLAPTEEAGDGRPAPALMNALAGAGLKLLADNDVVGASDWIVWSDVEQSGHPVVLVHVDNSWDTQRRRGARSTWRTILPAP